MISRLNLYDAKCNKINMESIGLFGLKLRIPGPSYTLVKETLDNGRIIILDKQLNPRQLVAEFITKANDYKDSLKLRDELFGLLGHGSDLYIGEVNVPGKWWKVELEDWDPERINRRVTKIEIPLFCTSGLAESINLNKKKYSSTSFDYKNGGNHLIDMTKQVVTEITFKGASTNLTITNNTTSDVWKYNGFTTASDIIKLKGVQAFKNGSSIFGQTNKKLLSFAVGNNEFTVSGASGEFELTISTRFYFL
ncbi:phage tail domain-containing protein [Psychrobacillus sp. FSL H8-0510]|uniref:phage tail domain-containing protein n=1 Tax=Psychrobacillus sp. FSL H8-0510 TaxID=2921394 RepID=UPI0030F5FF9A